MKEKKQKLVIFGGGTGDMYWQYQRALKKKITVVVETPNEVIYIKNGVVNSVLSVGKHIIKYEKSDVIKLIFVNTKTPCTALWGTSEKLSYKDKITKQIVEMGASGEYKFFINNAQRFYEKMAGIRAGITVSELVDMLRARVNTEITEHFVSAIVDAGIEYDRIDASKKQIAQSFMPKLNEAMEKYGIAIEDFIINTIVKPDIVKQTINNEIEEDLAYNDAKKKMARKMELEELNKQHEAKMRKADSDSVLEVEKDAYKARGTSYTKEREIEMEAIKVKSEAEARINESKKQSVNIVNGGTVVCPHCGSTVLRTLKNCSVCGKLLD